MRKLKDFLVSHYFIRVANGKFLVVEGFFIYMIIAVAIAVIGSLEFYDTWWIIPFLIPFLYGVYFAIFHPKIEIIDDIPGWRTRLRALKSPKLAHKFNTKYDKDVERELDERWQNEYNQDWEDMTFVNIHTKQPVLYVIIILILIWLWT